MKDYTNRVTTFFKLMPTPYELPTFIPHSLKKLFFLDKMVSESFGQVHGILRLGLSTSTAVQTFFLILHFGLTFGRVIPNSFAVLTYVEFNEKEIKNDMKRK